jgi:hypothetical protein
MRAQAELGIHQFPAKGTMERCSRDGVIRAGSQTGTILARLPITWLKKRRNSHVHVLFPAIKSCHAASFINQFLLGNGVGQGLTMSQSRPQQQVAPECEHSTLGSIADRQLTIRTDAIILRESHLVLCNSGVQSSRLECGY